MDTETTQDLTRLSPTETCYQEKATESLGGEVDSREEQI